VGLFTQFISLYFDTTQVSKIGRICSEVDEFERMEENQRIDFGN
jgi:hypothetical protein